MMGLTGQARVAFGYRNGEVVGSVQIARSAGTPLLDAAALAAVREAHYPKAPPGMESRLLPLLIWVEFRTG
jgi:protein TonB